MLWLASLSRHFSHRSHLQGACHLVHIVTSTLLVVITSQVDLAGFDYVFTRPRNDCNVCHVNAAGTHQLTRVGIRCDNNSSMLDRRASIADDTRWINDSEFWVAELGSCTQKPLWQCSIVLICHTVEVAVCWCVCYCCWQWLVCYSGWLGIGRSHADSAAEQKRLKIEPASPLPARCVHC